ncbi:type IV pilus modification protein PilV [Parahaliea mediterranea]|uniref:Type IV pilus modification protein PilV n=1 Tax=Parahaliea mediterranea TaxID=651086 RepID=A0A939DCH5_9GAMM|nr:type IV pilus modification protein PilV [Parahaliea mediterranea]MBN7795688.1 type IV pilus modification protein PilV [Parahaliea mediterranea]
MSVARSCSMRIVNRQSGMTLIEALAAFVILSIGLLGVVSLQALSKASQHQAIQRTQAVALANDLLERIRINPAGVVTYFSNGNALGDGTIGTEPSPNCTAATCLPHEMALHDRWVWERMLDGASVTVTEGGVTSNAAGLINPLGCVDFVADSGATRSGMVRVIVQWRGLEETSDATQAGDTVCGGAAAGADAWRRQVIVSSYVVDETEL